MNASMMTMEEKLEHWRRMRNLGGGGSGSSNNNSNSSSSSSSSNSSSSNSSSSNSSSSSSLGSSLPSKTISSSSVGSDDHHQNKGHDGGCPPVVSSTLLSLKRSSTSSSLSSPSSTSSCRDNGNNEHFQDHAILGNSGSGKMENNNNKRSKGNPSPSHLSTYENNCDNKENSVGLSFLQEHFQQQRTWLQTQFDRSFQGNESIQAQLQALQTIMQEQVSKSTMETELQLIKEQNQGLAKTNQELETLVAQHREAMASLQFENEIQTQRIHELEGQLQHVNNMSPQRNQISDLRATLTQALEKAVHKAKQLEVELAEERAKHANDVKT